MLCGDVIQCTASHVVGSVRCSLCVVGGQATIPSIALEPRSVASAGVRALGIFESVLVLQTTQTGRQEDRKTGTDTFTTNHTDKVTNRQLRFGSIENPPKNNPGVVIIVLVDAMDVVVVAVVVVVVFNMSTRFVSLLCLILLCVSLVYVTILYFCSSFHCSTAHSSYY